MNISSVLGQLAVADPTIAFIGGGNMASALIGGLLKSGHPATHIQIVEPFAEQRSRLAGQFNIQAEASASVALASADVLVWAVKPQTFGQAAAEVRPFLRTDALHLSVAAGIRSESIAQWLGTGRIIRAMPNTPALIGQGMTALFACPGTTPADRQITETILKSTGQWLWLDAESQLDAVTAISGSGPAYVFYFLEAMEQAGVQLGLNATQAHQLAVQTFVGASALAAASSESPATLRAQVTSKGGTTYAAISALQTGNVAEAFIAAMHAANRRAGEMGEEFGAG